MPNASTKLTLHRFEQYPVRVWYGIPYSLFLTLTTFDEHKAPSLWQISRLYPGRRGTTIVEYSFVDPKELAADLAVRRMIASRAAEAFRKFRNTEEEEH